MLEKTKTEIIRSEREGELIAKALDLISEQGVAALTMDKVVPRVNYSKGTIYSLFSSKEDLLTALCNQGLQRLLSLFREAQTFEGCHRERMLALGMAYLIYAQRYPVQFVLVISSKSQGLFEKTSPKRISSYRELERSLFGCLADTVEQAIAAQELTLKNCLNVHQTAFGIWSMAFGCIALLTCKNENCAIRADLNVEEELVNSINTFLDGLGWRPLSTEQAYSQTIARIKQQLFQNNTSQSREEMING